jgi:hypothetical protein
MQADIRYGAFDAAVRYELLGAEGVVGRFFTTINPFDTGSVLDFTVFGIGKAVQTPATVVDVLALSVVTSRSDTGQATDLYSAVLGKPFIDAAAATDVVTAFGFGKQIQDFVFATDDVNGAAVDDDQHIVFFKIISNTSAVFDTITLLATFDRAITDTSQVLDVAALTPQKQIASGAAVGDTISISFLLSYDFFNVVLVSTDQAELSIGKIIGDSPATTDSIGLVSAYDRLFGDATSATEVVSKTATISAADFVYLSDAVNVLLTTVRADLGLVVDAGQLLAQDYVDDPFYFADDYVGVKRIF